MNHIRETMRCCECQKALTYCARCHVVLGDFTGGTCRAEDTPRVLHPTVRCGACFGALLRSFEQRERGMA